MILSMKLSRCFTLCEKHNLQVSTRTSSKSATSAVELGFYLPDAGFRLIFLRKDFLNSLPHKLRSQSSMVGFAVSFLAEKQRNKF